MSDFSNKSISEIKSELINALAKAQKPNGEFETFAATTDGHYFYIGESPFATAHISYLLNDVVDEEAKRIVDKSVSFFEQIDSTEERIYKYWYGNTTGTSFPLLPFDLDDTSVVNQTLALQKRKTVDVSILMNNRSSKNLFYTWLKPSLRTTVKHPNLAHVFAEYFKMYPIFLKNSDGLYMAEYNDSEIIVRMNIYIMQSLMGKDVSVADTYFPFAIADVERELQSSLHYNNAAMYYLTLAKFQRHTSYFKKERVDELALQIRANIKQLEGADSYANVNALYLSLLFIEKLTLDDEQNYLAVVKNSNFENAHFKICVGNKKFKEYHEYCSADFTIAMVIRLLDAINK
jgi:hypothetical protein